MTRDRDFFRRDALVMNSDDMNSQERRMAEGEPLDTARHNPLIPLALKQEREDGEAAKRRYEVRVGHILDAWIEREFGGYGMAMRRESDPPIPGEPLMSMAVAKELTRRAVAEFSMWEPSPARPKILNEEGYSFGTNTGRGGQT